VAGFWLEPPADVKTSCGLEEEEGMITLNVSWEPAEDYFRNSPINTFHLTIRNSSMIVADIVEVKGQVRLN